jgi:hypothetical protein
MSIQVSSRKSPVSSEIYNCNKKKSQRNKVSIIIIIIDFEGMFDLRVHVKGSLGEKCNCKQTCTANDTGKEY